MSEQQPPAGTPEYLEYGGGAPIPPAAPRRPSAAGPAEPAARLVDRRRRRRPRSASAPAPGRRSASSSRAPSRPRRCRPRRSPTSSIDLDPSGWPEDRRLPHAEQVPGVQGRGRHQQRRRAPPQARRASSSRQLGLRRARLRRRHRPLARRPRGGRGRVDLGDDQPAPRGRRPGQGRGQGRAPASPKLNACDDPATDVGVDVHDGWAVLAESQKVADEVVRRDRQGHPGRRRDVPEVDQGGRRRRRRQRRTPRPAAGDYLAKQLGGLQRAFSAFGMAEDLELEHVASASAVHERRLARRRAGDATRSARS